MAALTAAGAVTSQLALPLPVAHATDTITFVGADHSDHPSQRFKVATIPAPAQPGHSAVLLFTRATAVAWTGPTGVAGWSQADTFASGALTSTVYTKVLGAGDPGAVVRSTPRTTPRPCSPWRCTAGSTRRVLLGRPLTGDGRVDGIGADDDARLATRDVAIGTGTGRYGSLLADEGLVTAGAEAAPWARRHRRAPRSWTLVLPAAGGGDPVDELPTASFTSSCTGLECAFDALASSDPEGPLVSYSGTSGTDRPGTGRPRRTRMPWPTRTTWR